LQPVEVCRGEDPQLRAGVKKPAAGKLCAKEDLQPVELCRSEDPQLMGGREKTPSRQVVREGRLTASRVVPEVKTRN